MCIRDRSHKNLDDLRSGERSLLVTGEEEKEDPLDFVLWKPKKEGEPAWESPWSDGRPGWHIECSVMSRKYLGEQIDIHAGGEDLIFPHHENEMCIRDRVYDPDGIDVAALKEIKEVNRARLTEYKKYLSLIHI